MVNVQGASNFIPKWKTVVTPQLRQSRSARASQHSYAGQIVVVEISANSEQDSALDWLSVHEVDQNGLVTRSATVNVSQPRAWVADVAAGVNGSVYIAEGPASLHRFSFTRANGSYSLDKLWTISNTEVVDMTLLANGSVYALSNGKGFRNEGSKLIPTTNPVLAIYNASGMVLFRKEYVEALPDVERKMFSLALVDPSRSRDAILGGYLRRVRTASSEKIISIGIYTFPSLFTRLPSSEEKPPGDGPGAADPNSNGSTGGKSAGALIAVGVCVAVVGVICIAAVALFVLYKKSRDDDKERDAEQGLVKINSSMPSVLPSKDRSVLV